MWKTRAVSIIAALSVGVSSFAFPAAAGTKDLCACHITNGQVETCLSFSDLGGDLPEYVTDQSKCGVFCGGIKGQGTIKKAEYGVDRDSAEGARILNECAGAQAASEQKQAEASQTAPETLTFVKPALSFDIPGLSFTDPLVRGDKLEVTYLADYVTAAYRMLLGISITIAIVMVMVGGIQYVLGAGTGEVKKAKERITNAVTGLVLMLGVYVILFTINPQLTLLPALRVDLVKEIVVEREDDEVAGTLAVDFKAPSGGNIQGPGLSHVPADLADEIEAVAKKLEGQGYGINVASSFRSVEKQIELIRENCQNPPGSATCNPKPGKPQTCILKGMDPARCPHTTGHALDLWATKKTSDGISVQCVSQKTCLGNMNSCFNDPCQKALIKEMKDQGFCVLASEAWHFEKPKMSSSCN